jgi:hypothetical protein
MSEVIFIHGSRELARGCLICGASVWDCTVDGCQPRGGNREGDVIHCKICNTLYVVEHESPARAVPAIDRRKTP